MITSYIMSVSQRTFGEFYILHIGTTTVCLPTHQRPCASAACKKATTGVNRAGSPARRAAADSASVRPPCIHHCAYVAGDSQSRPPPSGMPRRSPRAGSTRGDRHPQLRATRCRPARSGREGGASCWESEFAQTTARTPWDVRLRVQLRVRGVRLQQPCATETVRRICKTQPYHRLLQRICGSDVGLRVKKCPYARNVTCHSV